jgi:uncharacterized protein YndB with AHSA1/START domain
MSTNRLEIAAPPAAVFAVLMDARAYADWVVGSKRIRAIDDNWPAVGARFHHTVGAPGVDIDDSSKLVEVETNRRVVLEVRFRPAGIGVVTLDLEPKSEGRRTLVTMTEHPQSGAVRRWWSPALDALTHARNAYSLRRLARLSERRAASTR